MFIVTEYAALSVSYYTMHEQGKKIQYVGKLEGVQNMKPLNFAEVLYLDFCCDCYSFVWPYLDPNCLQSVSADDTVTTAAL